MRLHLLLLLVALPAASAWAAELRGSRASIRHQHEVAKDMDFTFLRTAAQVRDFVEKERLVEVVSNDDLLVHRVSFPYTRPILKLFIERLAAQFRRATGEQLVVTSLTRPTSMQPRNASPLSVHPAGMAVDFRIPASAAQRSWIEETLLSLERRGLLDATREKRPPHYHVAIFPDEYQAYVDVLIPREIAAAAARALENAAFAAARAVAETPLPASTLPAGPPPLMIAMLGAGLVAVAAGGLTLRHARSS